MDDKLTKLIQGLAQSAEANIARAYAYLGADPGPGTDIRFSPTNPITGSYEITGLTIAGKAFLERLYPGKVLVEAGLEMTQMKKSLADWGLAFEVDWSDVVDTKVDP